MVSYSETSPPPSQRSGKELRVVNISRSAPEAIEALRGKVNREVVRVAWSVIVVGEHILDELDGTGALSASHTIRSQ